MENENANRLLLEYDNPYWKNDPTIFGLLYKLIYEHPVGYHTILLSWTELNCSKRKNSAYKIYHGLYKQIFKVTEFLADPYWTLGTKCYCILNGITSFDQFPKCQTDGKFIKQNIYSITVGFKKRYCSNKCRANNAEFKLKMSKIKCEKYGNIFGSMEKIKMTKLKRYGDRNYCNREKISATKKGFSAKRKNEIAEKTRNTTIQKFGVDNAMKCKYVKEKQQNTCIKKYNRKSGFDYEKIKATNNKNLGHDWPMQSESVKNKSRLTCIAKYGVPNSMQAHDIQKKHRRRYLYDGNTFDSKPELAFYIWLKDNGIIFKYNKSDGIPYEFNGNTYMYFPDFEIFNDGATVYVEIKGKHFFTKDGLMFNPFKNKTQTDSEYKLSCMKYEAKHQCMIKNNVRIIIDPSSESIKYKEYAESRFGKNFWNKCRLQGK